MLCKNVKFDLRSLRTKVVVRKDKIIFDEPTVMAIDLWQSKIIAVGYEAKKLKGRCKESIKIIEPIKDEEVLDVDSTRRMLKFILKKSNIVPMYNATANVTVANDLTQMDYVILKRLFNDLGFSRFQTSEISQDKKSTWTIKTLKFFAFLILIGTMVYFTFGNVYLPTFDKYVLELYSPIQLSVSAVANKTENFFSYLDNVESIKKENEELKKENQTFKNELQNLDIVKLKNMQLMKLLKLETLNSKELVAEVIGNDGLNTLIINKGKKSGLKTGMAVVCEQGLVGRVENVENDKSSVMIISNPKSSISARINSTRELVLVNGDTLSSIKGLLKLEYIPIESNAKVGDVVVTSGNGLLQSDIVIGEIVEIKENDDKLSKKGYIKSCCNLRKIEEVIIIM